MDHELTMELECVIVAGDSIAFRVVNTYDQPIVRFFDVDPEVAASFKPGDKLSFNIAASISRIDRKKAV